MFLNKILNLFVKETTPPVAYNIRVPDVPRKPETPITYNEPLFIGTPRELTDEIYVHCSATRPSLDADVYMIHRWHLDKGWSGVGYHYVIPRNGERQVGRDPGSIGAHVAGKNSSSIGICLVGGVSESGDPENNFTAAQFEELEKLLAELVQEYPAALIKGHNEESSKACPSFNIRRWVQAVAFPNTSIA